MIVFKIILISLAVIALLAGLMLLLRIKLVLGYSEGFQLRIKVLCFTFGNKKKKPAKKQSGRSAGKPQKKKKQSKFAARLKKKFGLDIFDSEELRSDIEKGGLTEKVSQFTALIMMFAGQIKWLFSKLRIDKLYTLIICGGDAADAAIDYGIVCAAVYPLAGYLTASMNMKKDAEDVRVGCDFEGDSRFEFELIISIRILHLLTAAVRALSDMAVIAENTEVINNEQ